MRLHAGLACGAFAVAASAAGAQLPQPAPAVASQLVQQDHYPIHNPRFANGVRGVPGVVYWTQAGDPALTLDLYLPPPTAHKPATGFPLVLYLHGGGASIAGDWSGGDPRHLGAFVDFPGVLAALAARGYVVASVNYRLSSEAIFPAQIQDVKTAIRFLRTHATEYGIDPARAIVWGESAGAHLAAMAAVSCGAASLEPQAATQVQSAAGAQTGTGAAAGVSDCVQGAVTWFGVFDMETIQVQAQRDGAMSRDVPTAPEWKLLGCFAGACSAGQATAASPVAYVDAHTPPMLLITGDADKTVPHQQTLEMAETLKQAGVAHDVMLIPKVGYAFIGATPQQTRDANLAALQATFQFIDQTAHATK